MGRRWSWWSCRRFRRPTEEDQVVAKIHVGTRVRCKVCGSEAVVITAGDAQLQCCNQVVSQEE
jgi:hypothetical protein